MRSSTTQKRGLLAKVRHAVSRYFTQQNAGILFYYDGPEGRELLLSKRNARHGKGLWGGPGGKQDPQDHGDLWKTAIREAQEEYGTHPALQEVLAQYVGYGGTREPVYWHGPLGYIKLRIYAVKMLRKPDLSEWPSRDAPDHGEWTEARWFRHDELPGWGKLTPGNLLLVSRMVEWE